VKAIVANVFKPSDASLKRQVYGWYEFVKQMSHENNRESEESPEAIKKAASKSQATYDSVMVHFDTIAHLEKQRPKIEAELGFVTSSILDEVKRIRNYVRLGKVITIALGLIALIIGSIGIWNSLHASVVRKTKEIGIIKALGASGKDIAFIFLAEAAIIGITAGILGWCVGALFIELAKSLLKLQLGTPLLVHPIWLPLAAVFISLAVSLGAALRPAIVAGKKEAMEAIRSL
jgi:putative ABC transport system permease protein